ncbi:hypothetical protein D9M71_805560 [compost metagenome]
MAWHGMAWHGMAWHGRPGIPDTGVQSYKSFFEQLALCPQHADIVSTKKQHALSAIYPDDYFCLALEKADILVYHEARIASR